MAQSGCSNGLSAHGRPLTTKRILCFLAGQVSRHSGVLAIHIEGRPCFNVSGRGNEAPGTTFLAFHSEADKCHHQPPTEWSGQVRLSLLTPDQPKGRQRPVSAWWN